MRWHVYCRVVDNLGDVGFAWRLAADLAERGEDVRLAIDDASALAWMAPDGAPGVQVCAWDQEAAAVPDVVVELFGGGLPDAARRDPGVGARPVRINVEHLSAEPFVERSHRLRSGGEPATWYFYPGFTERTGGLVRERGLLDRRDRFEPLPWLRSIGVSSRPDERRVSLFCYGNPALPALLDSLSREPTLLLATCGAASEQVRAALGQSMSRSALRAVALPALAQVDFDRLLWSCDLNFVRGEDSLVRAVWAGVPFAWQPYVQSDGAHLGKLEAFLDAFLAGAEAPLAGAVRAFVRRWNGGEAPLDLASPSLDFDAEGAWPRHCRRWRDRLSRQPDLTSQLLEFARSRR